MKGGGAERRGEQNFALIAAEGRRR